MVAAPVSALAGEIEQTLLARLAALTITPERIAGIGAVPAALSARYPGARWTALTENADADLIWDSPGTAAAFAPYDPAALHRVKTALAANGMFFFATLGPQTLLPLQPLCAATSPAFAAWPTLVELGDALTAAGLVRPVLDREILTFTYASATAALAELAQDGWFTPETREADAARALTVADGSAAVPFEIFYGIAWNSAPAWQPLHFRR